MTNWAYLGGATPSAQLPALEAIDAFFEAGSPVERVYWFGATDYGGGTSANFLTDVVETGARQGETLGAILAARCCEIGEVSPPPPPVVGGATWEAAPNRNCYPADGGTSCTSGFGAQCHPCCGRDTWYNEATVESCKARCAAANEEVAPLPECVSKAGEVELAFATCGVHNNEMPPTPSCDGFQSVICATARRNASSLT